VGFHLILAGAFILADAGCLGSAMDPYRLKSVLPVLLLKFLQKRNQTNGL
jgi:hypothetical protein